MGKGTLAVLFGALSLGAGYAAAEPGAELGGQVYEFRLPAAAPPLAPVKIELRDELLGKVAEAEPDPLGIFKVTAAPGVYSLHVLAAGTEVAKLNVALIPGSEQVRLGVPTEPIGNALAGRAAQPGREEGPALGVGGGGTAGTPEENEQAPWEHFVPSGDPQGDR